MKEITIKPINTNNSFKKAASNFHDFKDELPIGGGWGFNQENAIVIENKEVTNVKNQKLGLFELENVLIDYLIELEFHQLQDDEHKYRDLHWKVEQQDFIHERARVFDKITLKIKGLHIQDYISQKKEWKENGRNPDFDKTWFQDKSEELTQSCSRTFWFEISSFYK